MNSHFKFPRRVRIHGGECGAVARALHHEAQKAALTQNEQSLISDECLLLRQADSGKALGSTFIERKQMSTKTTLKRIALVAVSALGFGMLSVAPSSGAQSALSNATSYVTDITLSTNVAPVAGALGAEVFHTVRFLTQTTATVDSNPKVLLITRPTGSAMALTAVGAVNGTVNSTEAEFATTEGGATAASDAALSLASTSTAVNGTYKFGTAFLNAHYDVAGTYKWTFWDDLDVDGVVDNGEYAETFTVSVSGADTALTVTLTPFNSTSAAGSTTSAAEDLFGSLVKVTAVDASGAVAAPSAGGGVKITASGSGLITMVNGTAVTPIQAYTLTSADFNGSGNAWINVESATAETVTLSISGVGANDASGTSKAVTFSTVAGTTTASPVKRATLSNVGGSTNTSYTAPVGSYGLRFKTGSVAASTVLDRVNVFDTTGRITGKAGVEYTLVVGGNDTALEANPGSFTITFPALVAGDAFELNTNDGAANTVVTAAARAATTVTVVTSAGYSDSIRAAAGATVTLLVNVDDQFGNNMGDVTVTPTMTGRNASQTLLNRITDSAGNITFSYTDTSSSTTNMVDTITFTANTYTDTASVTYTSAADLGASTVVLTTSQTDSTGVELPTYTFFGINAGDGVQGTLQTVTATVKDANGAVIAGVPVTFTVAGTGVAITSTTAVTRWTGSAGTTTASIYGWIAGSYTVTATAGTKSDTVVAHFAQTGGATYARTISAPNPTGRVITATAKDRLGNLAIGTAISARITSGDCFFGTGTNIASGTTGTDGTIKFLLSEGPACTVDIQAGADGGSSTYAQTDALKGTVDDNDPENTFTATTVGTATTAEVGVGASFDAAGVNKVSVSVPAGQATKDAAEAATDAAAEAIDAANAATDAANLAAEAADAATVAAEEARDAADAATAAVEELATQVATLMAALKAQITTLANTVAKIAKKVKA